MTTTTALPTETESFEDRLVGILSNERGQMVFYDTPGVHRPLHRMNRQMMRHALDALNEADVVCVLVDASVPFGSGDRYMVDLLQEARGPKVLALNKVDLVAKPSLLPLIDLYAQGKDFEEIIPISARSGEGTELLLDRIWGLLPVGVPLYDPELLTLHPQRFLAAERIREKVLEQTRNELPYTTAVVLEHWDETEGEGERRDGLRIFASILVERPGQKKILIGRSGQKIKEIGTAARLDLERFLKRPVYLDLRVRLEPGWRENQRLLTRLERDLY